MEAIPATAVPPDFESWIILLRMAERILLTLFFVITAAVIMIVYRKKIQDVDLNLSNETGSLKTTTSFMMPVFILLTVILFTYVVLLNPISVSRTSSDDTTDADAPPPVITAFLGYENGLSGERKLAQDLLAVTAAASNLRRAATNLPANQQATLSQGLDQLGQGTRGLQNMLVELLIERFPAVPQCYPVAITGFAPIQDTACADLNAFLFE